MNIHEHEAPDNAVRGLALGGLISLGLWAAIIFCLVNYVF
jgi:hypothetical protein